MSLLPRTKSETFNLLSIGQRGVGKTVFLAGSYAELHSDHQTNGVQQLWFDCQDTQMQERVEGLLSYVAQTGQYPPLTIKVTDFNFSLKRHSQRETQTLCNFLWHDIPGEICHVHNREFRKLVNSSHGCCVFVDAYALMVQNPADLRAQEQIVEQVTAIANLVYLNQLKYAFAIILTKSDLLDSGLDVRRQIQKSLQPLTKSLEAASANYQMFYSGIPIVQIKGVSTLKAEGAAVPLIWLVWELCQAHSSNLTNKLLELFTWLLPSQFQLQQNLPAPATFESIFNPTGKASTVKKLLGRYWFPSRRRYSLLAALGIAICVGIIGSLFVDCEQLLPGKSNRSENLSNLAIPPKPQQLQDKVPFLEKLVQQEPENLELRLQLAQVYEFLGEATKAEAAYDQVLAKEPNNYIALSRKAVLRHVQGDTKQAVALFAQSEKAAPADLKTQIQALAQKTLQTPAKPKPSAK